MFICVKCEKSFVTQKQSENHSKNCEKKYCCQMCNIYFKREYKLIEHLNASHGQGHHIISVIK